MNHRRPYGAGDHHDAVLIILFISSPWRLDDEGPWSGVTRLGQPQPWTAHSLLRRPHGEALGSKGSIGRYTDRSGEGDRSRSNTRQCGTAEGGDGGGAGARTVRRWRRPPRRPWQRWREPTTECNKARIKLVSSLEGILTESWSPSISLFALEMLVE
jgi:hypothetical protein